MPGWGGCRIRHLTAWRSTRCTARFWAQFKPRRPGRRSASGRGTGAPGRGHRHEFPRQRLRWTRPSPQLTLPGGKPLKAPEKVFWGGYSEATLTRMHYAWELAMNPFWPLGNDGSLTLPVAS